MRGRIVKHRINFKSGSVAASRFRYDAEGWGLVQLYFGIMRDGRLSPSHTNHNSQKRARNWESLYKRLGPVDAWNWSEVSRVSGRLNRFIKSLATGRQGSRPILPVAQEGVARAGIELALN
jgi:hypothetical protein